MLRVLRLNRDRQCEGQHQAGHRHHPDFLFACHPAFPLSPITK